MLHLFKLTCGSWAYVLHFHKKKTYIVLNISGVPMLGSILYLYIAQHSDASINAGLENHGPFEVYDHSSMHMRFTNENLPKRIRDSHLVIQHDIKYALFRNGLIRWTIESF